MEETRRLPLATGSDVGFIQLDSANGDAKTLSRCRQSIGPQRTLTKEGERHMQFKTFCTPVPSAKRRRGLAIAIMGCLAMATGAAQAAKVGYNRANDALNSSQGLPAGISAAGHTAVPVAAIDAASLAGLDALVVVNCGPQPLLGAPNPALDAAVQNGMTLLIESNCVSNAQENASWITSANLPGAPTYTTTSTYAYPEADDIDIPTTSPIRTGPGGTLGATSLDRIPAGFGGTYNMTHYFQRAALPAGATVLLTTGNADHVGAFAWQFGAGRVIHSETQSVQFLPGSAEANSTESFAPGMRIYFANLLAWATSGASGPGGGTATCASEGYTGTKLTWCVKICESGISERELDTWIQRWITQFRKLPYCALPGGGTTSA